MALRTTVVGGEAFRRPVAERLRVSCAEPVRIINEYGPTEAVVGCVVHRFDPLGDVTDFGRELIPRLKAGALEIDRELLATA